MVRVVGQWWVVKVLDYCSKGCGFKSLNYQAAPVVSLGKIPSLNLLGCVLLYLEVILSVK